MTDPPARRWLARAWSAAAVRLRPADPGLALYAFGKHPAFADFIDVARLPPVPAAFRHFHDHLRPAVERDGGPADPTLIAWHDGRGTSAVVLAHPSRDRGDAVTGWYRRCPLLLGVSARSPLVPLLGFADRLTALAEGAMAAGADGVLARIAAAAADWPPAFDGRSPAPPHGPAGRAAAALRDAGDRTPVVVVAIGVAASIVPGRPTADTLAAQLRSLPERPQF